MRHVLLIAILFLLLVTSFYAKEYSLDVDSVNLTIKIKTPVNFDNTFREIEKKELTGPVLGVGIAIGIISIGLLIKKFLQL